MSYFSMGTGTHRVPFSMHRRLREKLAARLREKLKIEPTSGKRNTLLLMKGGGELSLYDSDTTWDFRQEANFQYLFGCKEPGLLGGLDIGSGQGYLFVPKLDEVYATWLGPIRGVSWFAKYYEIGEQNVFYLGSDELKSFLGSFEEFVTPLGVNLDSGLPSASAVGAMGTSGSGGSGETSSSEAGALASLSDLQLGDEAAKVLQKMGAPERNAEVWHSINECRSVKDDEEVKVIEFACRVSSLAHLEVMKKVVSAASSSSSAYEYHSEAEFRYQSFLRGCARVGYSCICPSGERAAVLHYGHSAEPNMEAVISGQMKLHDMGAEYHCYSADVTCSFPVSGKFSENQKTLYEAVWTAVETVERKLKEGVRYGDMHRLAQRTLLEQLRGFIFKADADIDAMLAANLVGKFMPHGLGHMLGLAVHDVGGYVPGESRATYPAIKENLRLNRVLQKNFVLTVEPGFYFIPHCIKAVFEDPELSKFMLKTQAELLELAQEVGGIRIEDDVVITAEGCRVLNNVPRTVADIEGVMQGKFDWDMEIMCPREYKAA
ncbi:unnamed protein product [Amoebophrya sp. A25]|nr:unnamed protein product [Amoebophrya sp. A25]|eukprot:GSA25T00026264001.1